jgi:hypothetical protein
MRYVKWLKEAKLEDLESALVIWIRQVNVNNVTATDEVIKEHEKVLGQQMNVANFIQLVMYFASKVCRITWYYTKYR